MGAPIIRFTSATNADFVQSQIIENREGSPNNTIMDGAKDDLKWFGEGFDGFPKRLPDDCVEYMLFIIDTMLTQKEVLTRLEVVRKEAIKLTGTLLKDYIWQREDFNLKLTQSNGV